MADATAQLPCPAEAFCLMRGLWFERPAYQAGIIEKIGMGQARVSG
ncbi:MAG: hypothetical protein JHC69_10440 [Akkermansiaceae bacterium]|nr:hypothetical protein [Akkermansiaceae bacterium]